MTDAKPDDKKVLTLGASKLQLKKPVESPAAGGGSGQVKQSFSHGRSKTVAVEVKRRRDVPAGAPGSTSGNASGNAAGAAAGGMNAGTSGSAAGTATAGTSGLTAATLSGASQGTAAASPAAAGSTLTATLGVTKASENAIRQLTDEERTARARALRSATLNENLRSPRESSIMGSDGKPQIGPRAVTSLDARRAATPDALRTREMEEMKAIQEQERATTEANRQKHAARVAPGSLRGSGDPARAAMARRAGEQAAAKAVAHGIGPVGVVLPEEESANNRKRGAVGRRAGATRTRPEREDDKNRRGSRMTVTQALSSPDGDERVRSVASFRRALSREKMKGKDAQGQVQKFARDVIIPEVITVQELANRMAERGADVIKSLMKMGVMATITQVIDADTAELIVTEFGHKVKRVAETDVELGLGGDTDKPEDMQARSPVVTVMGHVDHGKTSLLDAIRKADVAAGEAGGITQHIGAYQVALPDGRKITFIDTPGHAAFTEMRARGANVTDIVILVVAADDGIMPQTVEAIRHAKAASVPLIVAINKIDLPGANTRKVRETLLQHDLQVEEMGGDVLSVEVSAKTKQGVDKLLETILLQAELLDLKANPNRIAQGTVIEAKVEKGRGSVATVLVQKGTVRSGDIFVAGSEWGRVRMLLNERGETLASAGPAMPVEVLGLQGTPLAGDDFVVVPDESKAREISEFRARRRRLSQAAAQKRGSLEQMMEGLKAGTAKELPVLIKGDVQGSVEAIRGALMGLTTENTEVRVRVLDATVGAISESDVTLCAASKGMILGFNVRANPQAREMAKRDGVEIRYYAIIYEIIDDVKAALSGLLSPDLRENTLGYAEILEVFNITKVGKVAGCRVSEGVVKRGARVRLLRDNVVIHEGDLKTLKRMKDEVKEVKAGFECGMAFANYDDIQMGDRIEVFEVEKVARSL